jgi:hypothetical protein
MDRDEGVFDEIIGRDDSYFKRDKKGQLYFDIVFSLSF